MTGSRTEGTATLDDVKAAPVGDAPRSGRDTPKPHGDKLGAGTAAAETSSEASPGDSPKPHGDKLGHALDEAARG